nr:unnamed protein product [Spirometra erinaceieuropaei]
MNQRTYQGTTLLDSAKTIVETFYKARMNKYRVDQYFIFTLNPSPHHIKLAGWRQSSDLQSLHAALSQIKPDGTSIHNSDLTCFAADLMSVNLPPPKRLIPNTRSIKGNHVNFFHSSVSLHMLTSSSGSPRSAVLSREGLDNLHSRSSQT